MQEGKRGCASVDSFPRRDDGSVCFVVVFVTLGRVRACVTATSTSL